MNIYILNIKLGKVRKAKIANTDENCTKYISHLDHELLWLNKNKRRNGLNFYKTSDAVYIPRQHMQDNFMTCIFAHIQ